MIKNIEYLLESIYAQIRANTDIAVLGMSGGADSTLVAVLCVQALGKENVYGVGMPYNTADYSSFNNRSARTAEHLGIKYCLTPVGEIADSINNAIRAGLMRASVAHSFSFWGILGTVNEGNARSRARMCVLYGTCHTLGSIYTNRRVRVIGTGNLSEDYIGYDTKGGDALCDFFPIGELFKSEVYQLLDYFIAKGILTEEEVDRVPSAGLWEGQTDEGELGHSYNEMEPVIRRFLHGNFRGLTTEGSLEGFVFKRHIQNMHKHQAPLVFKLRSFIEEEVS
jgi:NAD+ synthase